MAQVINRLGSWQNESITASLRRDDQSGAVSRVILENNAPQACRFRAWSNDNPTQVREVVVQPGTTDTYNAQAGQFFYFPEEPEDGSPASNFGYGMDYPA